MADIEYIPCTHLESGAQEYFVRGVSLGENRTALLCAECAQDNTNQVLHGQWGKVVRLLNDGKVPKSA